MLTVIFYTSVIGYLTHKWIRFILVKFYWGSINPSNEINVQGKLIIITGCNTGIGKTTALNMVKRGAHVIMACRNITAAKEAMIDIEKQTQSVPGPGPIEIMKLDLSSLDSVRSFVQEFKSKYDRLDILINNAGVFSLYKDEKNANDLKTKDGFEYHMGVNHLGHFLLTNLLLEPLKKAAPSRIINVSSLSFNYAQLNFDDLMSEKMPTRTKQSLKNMLYANSKLANVLFNYELGKKLDKYSISTYALCPGFAETDVLLGRDPTLPMYITIGMWLIYKLVGKSAEQGCHTTLYCALSKDSDVVNKTGEVYHHCKYWEPRTHVKITDEDAQKLWAISEKLVGL